MSNEKTNVISLPIDLPSTGGSFRLCGESVQMQVGSVWVDICSLVRVLAKTVSEDGDDWGRLLEILQPNGNFVQWVLPMSWTAGDGKEYRAHLANLGMVMPQSLTARDAVRDFLTLVNPSKIVTYYSKIGWDKTGKIYISGDEILGAGGTELAFKERPGFGKKGTFSEWQEKLASKACGQRYLVFGLAGALAGPFLKKCGIEGGGFHFQGESSTGKTTLLRMQASCWGSREFIKTWRTTDNALESLAADHNDGLLCLDEISMVHPTAAGNIAYMLGNGEGKGRLRKTGDLQGQKKWRLLFFSTGEIGLEEKMAESGEKGIMRAGQAMRTLTIPVVGKFGIIEGVDSVNESRKLIEEITYASEQFYGWAGREMILKWIQIDGEGKIGEYMREFLDKYLNAGISQQFGRALNRFAFVAAIGRLAEDWGIFPWKDQSFKAAEYVTDLWLQNNGGGVKKQREHCLYESRIKGWVFKHTDRFEIWEHGNSADPQRVKNRVGFKKQLNDGMHYYIRPESWSEEICNGLDSKAVASYMKEHGYLKIQGEKTTDVVKLPGGSKTVRCYHILPKILEDEEEN